MTTAHFLEKGCAAGQLPVWHPIAGMKFADRCTARQRTMAIVQRKLVRKAASLDRPGLMQLLAQTQDCCSNGQAFFFIRIEQRVGCATQDVGKFPSQVPRILHAGVESLIS